VKQVAAAESALPTNFIAPSTGSLPNIQYVTALSAADKPAIKKIYVALLLKSFTTSTLPLQRVSGRYCPESGNSHSRVKYSRTYPTLCLGHVGHNTPRFWHSSSCPQAGTETTSGDDGRGLRHVAGAGQRRGEARQGAGRREAGGVPVLGQPGVEDRNEVTPLLDGPVLGHAVRLGVDGAVQVRHRH
jgi:hypothetical protein